MSTPSGSRWSRASPRARGGVRDSARGGFRGRPTQQQSREGVVSSANRGNSSQPSQKPTPRPPEHKNKVWSRSGTSPNRNSTHVSSAILSHAGPLSTPKDQPWRNAAEQDNTSYKQRMSDLYQKLKERRERERRQAIKDGFLADPDKPRSLANAITPVGTCQDMCPEFERVERIVQLMVDANEKIPSMSDAGIKVPCEELMVKRFRRSAAGYDEQLPSDIRPPRILQKTLNHLFESVIGGPEPLANTHKFVWDRTRGIRNDFSIQQVSKVEDLKIAIDCFERIARFHILSLHQLSHPSRDNGEFDHHQEREQLNNTLLSLMYYYEDSRHKLTSPNEAEFRAYCIIFEIQDQRPDLEDRAQNWPSAILKDSRVKTALKLYAAAGNTSDEQGPLRPRTSFATAQANTRGFFELVQSNSVSYVMACVAEIYFNLVRSTALESIWTAYKIKRPGSATAEDWLMEDLTHALGFDYHDQSRAFCEEHGFRIQEREDGEEFLNLGSVTSRTLTDHNPRRKQIFSKYVVESKRLGRSFPAVVNGLSFLDAQSQGLVDASDADSAASVHSDSLFVNGDSDGERSQQRSRSASPPPKALNPVTDFHNFNGTTSPFKSISDDGIASHKLNPFKSSTSIQSQPLSALAAKPGSSTTSQVFNPFATKEPSKFDFSAPSNQEHAPATSASSPFGGIGAPKFDFSAPSNQKQATTTSAPSPFGSIGPPKFDFRLASNAPDTDGPKTQGVSLTNGESESSMSAAFSAPSVKSTAESTPTFTSILGNDKKTTAPRFIFGAPSIPSISPSSKPSSNLVQNKAEGEPRSHSTEPEPTIGSPAKETPKFSSGASPLFQSSLQETRNDSQSLISEPTLSSQSGSFDLVSKPPDSISSTLESPLSKPVSQGAADVFKSSPKQLSGFTSITPTSEILPASNSLVSNISQSLTPTKEKGALKSIVSNLPQIPALSPSVSFNPPQEAQTFESALAPISSTTSFQSPSSSLSESKPLAPTIPLPNPRPAALDRVTTGLMFDDGGLLQQYIEISVVPIVKSAIAQFLDEESWKIARQYRFALLSKKYLRKWKMLAWKLGVTRRGRNRRQTFARSVQSLAKSTQERAREMTRSSILDVKRTQKNRQQLMASETDHLLSPALSAQKRQSLPVGVKVEMSGSVETPRNTKRKLDDFEPYNEGRTSQSYVLGHKRSSTVDSTLNANLSTSAPPQLHLQAQSRKNLDSPKLVDRSVDRDTIMNHARRIAPNTYSDTTQTDYFRLKALGINPDTPVAPLTKKRVITVEEDKGAFRTPDRPARADAIKSHAQEQNGNNASIKTDLFSSKDDDEFFASIRAIRSTLADSTSWFQSERKSIEKSMTPSQASMSPPSGKKETAAERRLREIRERGSTPSRSEIRLRAMGDKSLLPANFWDGERKDRRGTSGQKGKRKSHEWENRERIDHRQKQKEVAFENGEVGFAALVSPQSSRNDTAGIAGSGHQRPQTGGVNGFGQHNNIQVRHAPQNNGNIDDIIELSD